MLPSPRHCVLSQISGVAGVVVASAEDSGLAWKRSVSAAAMATVLRVTLVEPGVVATELPNHITHADTKHGVQQLYDKAEVTLQTSPRSSRSSLAVRAAWPSTRSCCGQPGNSDAPQAPSAAPAAWATRSAGPPGPERHHASGYTSPAAIIENNIINGNVETRNNTPAAAVSGNTVGGTTVTR